MSCLITFYSSKMAIPETNSQLKDNQSFSQNQSFQKMKEWIISSQSDWHYTIQTVDIF